MQGIRRTIVISVMLHSALLAAVFAIGYSSRQQTKPPLIVSLIGEWQQKIAGSSLQPAPHQRTRTTPAAPPDPQTHSLASGHTLPAEALQAKTGAVGRSAAPGLQTFPAVGGTPAIQGGTDGTSRGGAAGDSLLAATAESPAVSFGGAGQGTESSEGGTAGVNHQPDTPDPALGKKIRDMLQANIVYPYLARIKRIEGTVLAEFRLNSTGMPEHMRVVKTSQYAILDEAAKETIQKAAPFPARNRRVEIPITFRLRERN